MSRTLQPNNTADFDALELRTLVPRTASSSTLRGNLQPNTRGTMQNNSTSEDLNDTDISASQYIPIDGSAPGESLVFHSGQN